MRVAFQMDALSRLNLATDTTLMLAEEALARGFTCYHYRPDQLSWRDGALVAPLCALTYTGGQWQLGAPATTALDTMDVIWMRQDPPFDLRYITACHLLELLPPTTRVVNDPHGVRNAPEKLAPLAFRTFMPPTLISLDLNEILDFTRDHGTIVAKPLYGYGGRSVFKYSAGESNIDTLVEMLAERGEEPWMWQQFLPAVATSDKRILLIDGQVASVFQRRPAEGSIRANMRVGGTPEKATLTPREEEICTAVAPSLHQQGILLAGLDVIGDHLTEINVTSPTGLRAAQALYGTNLAATLWDHLSG